MCLPIYIAIQDVLSLYGSGCTTGIGLEPHTANLGRLYLCLTACNLLAGPSRHQLIDPLTKILTESNIIVTNIKLLPSQTQVSSSPSSSLTCPNLHLKSIPRDIATSTLEEDMKPTF